MSRWRITKDGQGMGGLLSPPGHPALLYTVEEGPPSNPKSLMSLEAAVEEEWVPEQIKERAQRLLDGATLTCSEDWVRQVYGYFKNSYSPDGKDHNVTNALMFGTFWGNADDPRPPAGRSLAVMCIRRYFPDHQPRLDLLDKPGWGATPCSKCGKSCQYEARIDGWMPFNGSALCEDGGPHTVQAKVLT